MAAWQWLLAAAAVWAVALVAWKVREAVEMAKFITDATGQFEGMMPQLQRDAAAFEAAWKQAWLEPQVAELIAHFGGPSDAAIAALFAEPSNGDVSHVVLHGEGTPPEGYTLLNFYPAGLRWTATGVMAANLRPGEYAFGHDEEGELYVADWATGGPVYRVPFLLSEAELRVEIAPSVAAFLAWRRVPGGV